MNHQQSNNISKPTPEAYVNRYIRFDPPSRMPSLLCPWSNSVQEVINSSMRIGCAVLDVYQPVKATEIRGTNARMMVRDFVKPPVRGLGLYDQFCVFELDDEESAYKFMDAVLSKTEHIGHQIEYLEGNTDRCKRFVVRSKDGYVLYCTTSIGSRFDPDNEQAADLFIHWQIDYYAPRKRKSNHSTTDRNLFDSATAA